MYDTIKIQEKRIAREIKILELAGFNPRTDSPNAKGFVSAYQADRIFEKVKQKD